MSLHNETQEHCDKSDQLVRTSGSKADFFTSQLCASSAYSTSLYLDDNSIKE